MKTDEEEILGFTPKKLPFIYFRCNNREIENLSLILNDLVRDFIILSVIIYRRQRLHIKIVILLFGL